MTRIELVTSSLPRKRSTPELHRQPKWKWAGDEGRTRDIQLGRLTLYQLSYSRLFSFCGESRIRTCEGKTNRFTVCPRWPLEYLPNIFTSRWRDSNPRPADYKSAALANWATSAILLVPQKKERNTPKTSIFGTANVWKFFLSQTILLIFLIFDFFCERG